ncbi:ABC transporter substrate-binding protein [Cellulomonas sp. KRMCY2]|uniref:ABC transporter substrate-binding protein n=1 Tax=Cellulomonas sp. KRMCY2 TaxID=1304865 RepID=UPI00045EB25B|nr:extracellular solute-binding protein [Cellulomonas sp. KRMCY2]
MKRSILKLAGLAAAAALTLTACSGADTAEAPDAADGTAEATEASSDEPVTLTVTWWGNDDRAARYEEALALFEAEHQNITIQPSFTDWPNYWPARATEAAGGSLPDVVQMDLSYLRQFGATGQLYDLDELLGAGIDVSGMAETLLPSGQIDGTTYAVPISTNAFAMFYNPAILASAGVEAPGEMQTWAEYNDFLRQVSEAGVTTADGNLVHGGADYTATFWIFIHWLNQQGKDVFTEDGQLAFTEDDLREWWNLTADLRADGVTFPADRATQLLPLGPFDSLETGSEMSWDNFIAGYLTNSGAESLEMMPIPSDDPGNLGLFLKPSMLYSIGANSEHPAEAALLIDFLVNDPAVAEVFGTSQGLRASSLQRDAVTLEGADAQVAAYEESIAEYLQESPPPPIQGFGTLETRFREISEEINYGSTSVDDAVSQWFSEAQQTIADNS